VSQRFETTTNKKGEFVQVGMRTGPYRITASMEGYRSAQLDAHIRLGDATNLGTFTLASEKAAQAAQHRQSVAEIREDFDAAFELTRQEKWAEAEVAFRTLVERKPEIPELHHNLGFVAQQKQDWVAAQAAYEKALELRPGYAEARMALATVYRESGQQDKAAELLAQAATENQDDPTFQFNLGVQLINSDKFPEAKLAFERCLAADPEMVEAYYHYGNVLLNQGQIPEAIESFETFLSKEPENVAHVDKAKAAIAGLSQYLQSQQ
jgi:tetratricopeptide (TPR) repeat protein